MTDFAIEKENAIFVSNIAHILSLTADNMIVAAGGIDMFMQRATLVRGTFTLTSCHSQDVGHSFLHKLT